MQKIIGVTELQRHFRAILDEVKQRRMPYVVTRGSRAEAALLPYEDFLRYQEMEEREVLSRFDRMRSRMMDRNAKFSDQEVAEDTAAARSELD